MILDGIFDMFDWLKAKFKKKEAPTVVEQTAAMTPKQLATAAGEPYVSILNLELDPATMAAGSIELDWNDIFVARLIKRGYVGKTDAEVVDQWFQEVCRGIVMELWEQQEAQDEPGRRVKTRDLGNGRTEVS